MKPGASVARRSRVKPAAEAITRSVELQSDTELSHAEPEVRIHLPPGKSLRTLGPSAADAARAGPTDFFRKAIQENKLGKPVLLIAPIFNHVAMALDAGAEVR